MNVVDLAPIVRSIDVSRSPADTYRIFTNEMTVWWPMERFSRARDAVGEKTVSVTFEPRPGGRIYETLNTGEEREWGEVLVAEPARRLLFTFQMGRDRGASGEVEVRFEPLGASACRVTLTHSGWERYGEEAAITRGRFANGWPTVFDKQFGDYANRV